MKLKVYEYVNCDTCRKAKKYLETHGIKHELIPIREQPPIESELLTMLECYDGKLRKLFNASGQDYKSLNMKDRVPDMSDSEAIDLLSRNGNLVKRPFAIRGKTGAVGFSEAAWSGLFL